MGVDRKFYGAYNETHTFPNKETPMDMYEIRALELELELNNRRAAAKDKNAFDKHPFEVGQREAIARYRRISHTYGRTAAQKI